MAKGKLPPSKFPHVEGLARKRTKFGQRWILTERDSKGESHSITVKILDNDPLDVFYRKITQARNELRNRQNNKEFSNYMKEYFVVRQLSDASIDLYRRALEGFSFDEKQNKKQVHRLLARDLKPSTFRIYIGKIDTFFNWLIRRGEQIKNPVCDIVIKSNVQPRRRTFTEAELNALINYANRHKEKSYTLFILLLIETGARVSTVGALTINDLDSGGYLHMYNVKAKKEYDYTIKVNSEAIKELWAKRAEKGKLWENPPDIYVKRLYHWMRDNFGLDENHETLSPHSLRHTFASRAVQNGVPIEIVSKLLDHASPAITLKVYARFSQDQIDDALEKATKKSSVLAPTKTLDSTFNQTNQEKD